MIKLKARETSIAYGASKKRAMKNREDDTQNEIGRLEKQFDDQTSSNEPSNRNAAIYETINTLKDELEQIIEHRTKGAILRSKSQWCNEGEKNTKPVSQP